MKRIFTVTLFLLFVATAGAANVATYEFARRDTAALMLDVYKPAADADKNVCVIYVFGGGFVEGSRTAKHNVDFFNILADRGYTVVAIDYRLGLKGVQKVGLFHSAPVFEAVKMATEDLISAVGYVVDNSTKLGVDTKRIVLMGSSAGAITVLEADYELANRSNMVQALPKDFRFAGVVSFAGAVFSTNGKVRYPYGASPTLFYHGTKDKIVVYNKLRLFKRGMFGTKSLVKLFDKNDYPYMAVIYEGAKHEVATFPRQYCTDQICNFIDAVVSPDGYTNELYIKVEDMNALKTFHQ